MCSIRVVRLSLWELNAVRVYQQHTLLEMTGSPELPVKDTGCFPVYIEEFVSCRVCFLQWKHLTFQFYFRVAPLPCLIFFFFFLVSFMEERVLLSMHVLFLSSLCLTLLLAQSHLEALHAFNNFIFHFQCVYVCTLCCFAL